MSIETHEPLGKVIREDLFCAPILRNKVEPMPKPLPADRVYLSQGIVEPAISDDLQSLFYVKLADGRRSIVRQHIESGLAEVITTEPAPKGGIGYGGAIFAIKDQSLVYAAKDNRIWSITLQSGESKAISPAFEGVAAPEISPCGKFVVFLAEQAGRCNVMLVSIDGKDVPLKLSDDPWYAFNPTFSPDGVRISWQEWDSQYMPWDESRLLIASFSVSTEKAQATYHLLPLRKKVLSKTKVSLSSPRFSPDGKRLAYTSDETGWRSIFIADADGENPIRLDTGHGEMGNPGWVPGQIAMRWSNDKTIYAVRRFQSCDELIRIDTDSKEVTVLTQEFTQIAELNTNQHMLTFLASSARQPSCLVTVDTQQKIAARRASTAVGLIDRQSLSSPSFLSWKTTNNEDCYGVFYPAVGAEQQKKPLVVWIHGGPTSERSMSWDPQAQYFATRGWHYLNVNHRGSTGFGRAYQDKLLENWGVVDIEDAKSGAEFLIQKGRADASQIVIMGGSAGGFTTLMAITQQPDFWSAGVSLYGVGNLYDLKQGSHRFEVNYEQSLIGPLPETGPRWKERSALTHAHKIKSPLLLFHGQEDTAVPYQQSIEFAEAARKNGVVAELVLFPDEGHGFVKEKNRREFLEKTMRFLDKYVICRQ
jgi:dipeptidyl aminopeptidase/acylaminoacyl peptidase